MEELVVIGLLVLFAGLGVVWSLRKFIGPRATIGTLLRTYYAFENKGASEEERLFQMFDTRMGWRSLPKPFLRELSTRLATKEDVITFVILAERQHRVLKSNLVKIAASGDPGFAVDQVAMTLTSLGNQFVQSKRPLEAEASFSLALRLHPKWVPALMSLGVLYHALGRYKEALPIVERFLEENAELNRFQQAFPNQLTPELFGSEQDFREMDETMRKIREECRAQLGRR